MNSPAVPLPCPALPAQSRPTDDGKQRPTDYQCALCLQQLPQFTLIIHIKSTLSSDARLSNPYSAESQRKRSPRLPGLRTWIGPPLPSSLVPRLSSKRSSSCTRNYSRSAPATLPTPPLLVVLRRRVIRPWPCPRGTNREIQSRRAKLTSSRM